MASDVEKELKEEEKELENEKPEVEEVEKSEDKKSKENPPTEKEMQMEAPKRENSHLRFRPVLVFWALVVVLFTAVLFFVIGMNYGSNDTTAVSILPSASVTASVSATASTSATADVTADWKTYTNNSAAKLGLTSFYFKYPSDWILIDNLENLVDQGAIHLSSDSSLDPKSQMSMGFYTNIKAIDKYQSPDSSVGPAITATTIEEFASARKLEKIGTKNIGGIDFGEYRENWPSGNNFSVENYYAEIGEKIIFVQTYNHPLSTDHSDDIYRNILSTFQFTK